MPDDNVNEPQCNRCGTTENVEYHGRLGYYCESCLELYTQCSSCNEYVLMDDSEEYNSQPYCTPCFNEFYDHCRDCGCAMENEEMVVRPDNVRVCRECFHDRCEWCTRCETPIWHEDVVWDEDDGGGEPFCRNCRRPPDIFIPSKTFNINKSQRKVGFELEFGAMRRPDLDKFGRIHGDGSLGDFDSGYHPYEFSSAIYNGDDLLDKIDAVVWKLIKANAVVNVTCGFHVHLDMSETSKIERYNIRNWWCLFEPAFMAMTSKTRRNNRYCYPVRRKSVAEWEEDRYATLNIAAFGKFGTYEFRLHQGTVEKDKIKNWILLLLSFVDTFHVIPAMNDSGRSDQYQKVLEMTDREKLIFFFHQLQIPFSMRKYVISRIKHFEQEGVSNDLKWKKPKKPNISKIPSKTLLKNAVNNIHSWSMIDSDWIEPERS